MRPTSTEPDLENEILHGQHSREVGGQGKKERERERSKEELICMDVS